MTGFVIVLDGTFLLCVAGIALSLAQHPACNIGIRDEYGADHAAVTE